MPYYVGEERIFTGPAVDSEEHPIVQWAWNFGDGTTDSSGSSVTHTYSDEGTYTVTLTTTNDCDAICEDSQMITILPLPECTQTFNVRNRQGLQIEEGWTLIVNIYDELRENLLEQKTAPVVTGSATVMIPQEDHYISAWAEKGELQTASAGFNVGFLCTAAAQILYQQLECNEATEHYPSGRALLEHYDLDGDGILTQIETTKAIMDTLSGTINTAEGVFVIECWETYNGNINVMCPSVCPIPPCVFSIT